MQLFPLLSDVLVGTSSPSVFDFKTDSDLSEEFSESESCEGLDLGNGGYLKLNNKLLFFCLGGGYGLGGGGLGRQDKFFGVNL